MSQENPTIDDIRNQMQAELSCLAGAMGEAFGAEIGNLQKQLNLVAGADTQALADLAAQAAETRAVLDQVAAALDGDPTTPGMQNLQNLLALIDRVAALETWKSGVDDQISQFSSTFTSLQDRLAAVEQGGANTCDCAQIATDIQGLRDQIVTLQGVDATQAQQLLALTGRLNGLDTVIAGINDQLAGMATSIATAGGNAQQALDAANAAQNAVNNLRDREDGRHQEHGNAIGMVRNQLYGMTTGLCDAVKPGFLAAFAASKAAALAA